MALFTAVASSPTLVALCTLAASSATTVATPPAFDRERAGRADASVS